MEPKAEWPGKWAEHRRKSPLPPEAERIRKWLRKVVKEKKITQAELSERADIGLGQVNRIMNGCSEMRISTLMKVVEAVGYRVVFVPEEKMQKMKEKKHTQEES